MGYPTTRIVHASAVKAGDRVVSGPVRGVVAGVARMALSGTFTVGGVESVLTADTVTLVIGRESVSLFAHETLSIRETGR